MRRFVPGGIGVAVHSYVVVALLVVVGGDAVAAEAAVDAGHQAEAAAGLGAADCWAEVAWMAALSQEWELSGQVKMFILPSVTNHSLSQGALLWFLLYMGKFTTLTVQEHQKQHF